MYLLGDFEAYMGTEFQHVLHLLWRRWDERDAKRVLTELQLMHVVIKFGLGRVLYTWRDGMSKNNRFLIQYNIILEPYSKKRKKKETDEH